MSRVVLTVAVACAVTASLSVPASADGLTDQRNRIKAQIAQTQNDLDDSNAALDAANSAVEQTGARLQRARAALAQTERELAAAKARDIAMAAKLKQAQLDLDKAKAAVAEGKRVLDAQQKKAVAIVRYQYQQQTNLLPIAMVIDDSTADVATRLQWSTTLFDTAASELDRLKELQRQLALKQAKQAELEQKVAVQRKAAAANLELKKTLQARAAAQEAAVASLLDQQQANQRTAAREVANDRSRYATLVRERASVERRIAIRIAKAKAEAARQAAAARKAREAARRAAAAKRAAERAHRSAAKRSSRSYSSTPRRSGGSGGSGGSSSGGSSGSHHGFIYPVNASITSPYGMRFHPVLHIWKLHDGTDFGAGCGTAIHAAHSGTVAERYFNAGYGNRLMIDHGMINGRFVTTGYNHATRYIVHVGQHVRQGQVIGYVGTTGYSTGCHLHLMVWLDGRVVNPMGWLY
jgi:murein DD-endopeptidase MepM/ murein hydrolase activator NlpD